MKTPRVFLDFSSLFRLHKPENRPSSGEMRQLSGGFSTARVFQYSATAGERILRYLPLDQTRLPQLYGLSIFLQELNSSLNCPVAAPLFNLENQPFVVIGDSCLILEPFIPGVPADRSISDPQLKNALVQLGQVHQNSAKLSPKPVFSEFYSSVRSGPSPSLLRRLELLTHYQKASWRDLSFHTVTGDFSENLAGVTVRLEQILHRRGPDVVKMLSEGVGIPLRLQPVLRDVWRDHIRFDGQGNVTGLIDPYASGVDSVLCDLSRYLGSVLGNDYARWRSALMSYEEQFPLTDTEHELLRTFDQSNLLLSAIKCRERIVTQPDQLEALAARLQGYLERLENTSSESLLF